MRAGRRARTTGAAGSGITCAGCSAPTCSPCATAPTASAAASPSTPTAAGSRRSSAATRPDEDAQAGEVRIWDAAHRRLLHDLIACRHLAPPGLSPDGNRLALAGTDGTVLVWDTGQRARNCCAAAATSRCRRRPRLQPRRQRLASAGWDRTVKVCEAATGAVLHALRGHAGGCRAWPSIPTAGGWPPAAGTRRSSSGTPHRQGDLRACADTSSPVYGVAFSPDGQLLASAGSNGNLKIWDLATGRVVQSLTGQHRCRAGRRLQPRRPLPRLRRRRRHGARLGRRAGVERFIFRGHTAAVGERAVQPGRPAAGFGQPAEEAAVKVWDLTRHPEYATFARMRGRGDDRGQRLAICTGADAAAPAQPARTSRRWRSTARRPAGLGRRWAARCKPGTRPPGCC